VSYDEISSLEWSAWRSSPIEAGARLAMERAWPEGSRHAHGDDAEILTMIGLEASAPRVTEARAIIEWDKRVRWEYRVRVRPAEA
jgi:hypothetical protein